MFDSLIESVQEFWDDVTPDEFCVPCFVKGLARGAAIGLTTLLVIASLPAAAAAATVAVLAVVGVAGAAVLAARWKTMTDREKSEVLGDLAGGVIAGGIGLARPPPGVQFLSASMSNGSTVLVPVLVTSQAPALAGAGAASGAAGGAVLSTGGGDGSDSEASQKQYEKDLEARSSQGDKEATYEFNKIREQRALESGDEPGARGYRAENKMLDEGGDNIVEAGRKVSYEDPNNPSKTIESEIDHETATQVVQVKSGKTMPSRDQTTATRLRAQETGKQPAVQYDEKRMPKATLKNYRRENPDFALIPKDLS